MLKLVIACFLAQFGMGGATIGVRLRRSCLSDQMASAYQLRYQGMNEGARDRSKPTVSRTVITVALTPPHTGERERGEGAHKFLEDMGFKLDFHLVLKGNVFVKDRCVPILLWSYITLSVAVFLSDVCFLVCLSRLQLLLRVEFFHYLHKRSVVYQQFFF